MNIETSIAHCQRVLAVAESPVHARIARDVAGEAMRHVMAILSVRLLDMGYNENDPEFALSLFRLTGTTFFAALDMYEEVRKAPPSEAIYRMD